MSRVVCHICGGGRSGERSCILSDNGAGVVFYHCFRASCPKPSGIYSGVYSATSEKRVLKKPHLTTVPSDKLAWMVGKFSLNSHDIGALRLLWTGDRYWFPVFDPVGEVVGGVARSYTKTPKSLMYIQDYSLGCWYGDPNTDRVWLVEDQLSAAKLSRGARVCALMGVHVSESLRNHLRATYSRVSVCLDADAISKSVGVAATLELFGLQVDVVPIDKDIKNQTDAQIEELLACSYNQ